MRDVGALGRLIGAMNCALACCILVASPASAQTMDIYWVDVEGGEATLIVAPTGESEECEGHWLKASVQADGTFTMTNGRNGYSRTYTAR